MWEFGVKHCVSIAEVTVTVGALKLALSGQLNFYAKPS